MKHFSWVRVYSVGLALLLVLYAFIIVHAVYLLKNSKSTEGYELEVKASFSLIISLPRVNTVDSFLCIFPDVLHAVISMCVVCTLFTARF